MIAFRLSAPLALAALAAAALPEPAAAQRRHNCLRSMFEMSDAEFQRCETVRARASVESGRICTQRLGADASKARMDACIGQEFTRLIR